MNGIAAVYAPGEGHGAAGEAGRAEQRGTMHATLADADGLPGSSTLCGRETGDMIRVPYDMPQERSDAWYPPGGDEKVVCRDCDRAAAEG
ncbi:hypothetical protein [Streptomyces mangrovisoli]|nr:hypothetical protein [Streptomyces mangrovisoli]